jgi:hypothetical protein
MFKSPARPNRYLKLARALRYRALPAAKGKLVTVRDAGAVVEDVVHQLGSVLPRQFRYDPATRVEFAPVVKHGILELTFEAPLAECEALTRLPRRELTELGFLGQQAQLPSAKGEGDQEDDEMAVDATDGCLDLLFDEIASERLFVKLFFDAISDRRSLQERELATLTGFQLPPDFFPATFRVRDACLTNAASIWVQRFFYL